MDSTEPHVFIIPTSHVSHESEELVKDSIRRIQPDIVGVELDKDRYERLYSETDDRVTIRSVRRSGLGLSAFVFLLKKSQQVVSKRLGIESTGVDMKAGIETAEEQEIPFALIDRPIQETLQSFRDQSSIVDIVKLLGNLVLANVQLQNYSDTELRDETDLEEISINTVVNELETHFPTFKSTFIDERDAWMSDVVTTLTSSTNSTIAIVVGAAHSLGIQANLEDMNVSYTVVSKEVLKPGYTCDL